MVHLRNNTTRFSGVLGLICLVLLGCGGAPRTTQPNVDRANKIAAIRTLNQTIAPAKNASVTTSADIDWAAGVLPWDRFTLPTISPNGLHAAVQLGDVPPMDVLVGTDNTPVISTSIELHLLDPLQGRRTAPLHIDHRGLLISRVADNFGVFVEYPHGNRGRWIGRIDWSTGTIRWLVDDEAINAFPTINAIGDLAWSRREQGDERFHLVIETSLGKKTIDDGKSDWLLPIFLGNDRLRAYKLLDGRLSLVEFDLKIRDPLLTAMYLPILETGATRAIAWQIATTNPSTMGNTKHAFFHPQRGCMVVWQPGQPIETAFLAARSFAAAPVDDGTWLVTTQQRVVRQTIGDEDGIHLRNQLAIPFATTSKQWTHLMLVPDGNRLLIRAINLE